MFAKPRPKKNLFAAPPPKRKRKAAFAIEEISFDDTARSDYLTGFHKRKVHRQKQAQEVATEKARQEKIAFRKQLREERKRAVEDHVQQVNETLRAARLASGEADEDEDEDSDDSEWEGIQDDKKPDFVDHEEEYIDEDRFTTVTVEAVDVDRDGMHRLNGRDSDDESEDHEASDNDSDANGNGEATEPSNKSQKRKKEWPKTKKKKFRYENKIERNLAQRKQKASNRKR